MKSPQLSGSRIITEDASSEMDGAIGIDEPENPVVSGGTSSVSEAALEDVENDEYFQSYEDLEVHQLMLNDVPRTEAYQKAILANSDFFRGKIVMDIGAGTGILSLFCAQAGAAKVYAIEGAQQLAKLTREVVAKNGFSHLIEVIHGKAEEIELPAGQKVDVIVSEWMGFYLLHESMLESVIKAREKHLKPDGVMLPSRAALYSAGCSLNTYHSQQVDSWKSMYGLDLSPVGQALLNSKKTKPEITLIPPGDLITEPVLLADFDLCWLGLDEIQRIHSRSFTSVLSDEPVSLRGVCLWFDCSFGVPGCDTSQSLSTSPQSPPTHWKQTVILLPGSINVEEGDVIGWELSLNRSGERGYLIELNLLDAEEDEHPVPCGCGQARCAIIAAFMSKEEEEIEELNHQ